MGGEGVDMLWNECRVRQGTREAMCVEIEAVYQGGLRCVATHGPSRYVLITDAPEDAGGQGDAYSPTDLVAVAVGTGVLTTLGAVAKREDLDVNGARVQVLKESIADPVRRIRSLKVFVTVPNGELLSPEDRAKLEFAATLCPVRRSLHPDVVVETAFVYEA